MRVRSPASSFNVAANISRGNDVGPHPVETNDSRNGIDFETLLCVEW
jgi:hypothetical protein